MERRLEPDDVRKALRPEANPHAHQAIQVSRADAASIGECRDRQAAVLALDFAKHSRDRVVNGGVPQPIDQKPLDASIYLGGVRPRHDADQVAKRRRVAERDPAVHDRVRGNAAQDERDAGTRRTPTSVAGDVKRRSSGRNSGPRKNHTGAWPSCS